VKNDFIMAINQVVAERQLPKEVVVEAIEAAIVSAYKRDFGSAQNITAKVDLDKGLAHVYAGKEIVAEVVDDKVQISLEDAQEVNPDAVLGEEILEEIPPIDFGRIAAQTAKQVILQRIREAERDALYTTYAEQEGEIINGTVQSIDSQSVILSLGKAEAILIKSEQIPTERYHIGQRLRAYVVEVSKTSRGPQINVSRTHRNMLRRLLELEVPEIFNGTVEIKAIAREAGSRSKVAVAALQEGVDPVGSCVGMRGVRIQNIVNELNGEKIDVVAWDPALSSFVANALSPAKVMNVMLEEADGKTATVVVPDKQLSLAIGKEGQNARLAAKLTGWRIDIKSATEAAEEALRKAETEKVLAVAREQHDILSIAETILREKEGATLSDAELQALSQAIEALESIEEPEEVVEEAVEEAPAVEADTVIEAAAELLAEEVLEVTEPESESVAEEEEVEEEPQATEPLAEPESFEEYLEETWTTIEEDFEEEEEEGEEDTSERRKKRRKKKQELVYDEDLGKVVMRRRRKPGRQRDEWEGLLD
jgi:N utilization substance protein A